MEKIKNILPNWLNIGFIILIVILLLIGCYPFLSVEINPTDTSGFTTLYSLVPFVISLSLYILMLFATTLFSYDLVTIMTVTLLFTSFGCFITSIFIKDISNKANLFSIGSAIFGLGSGMPIGKALSLAKQNK